MKNLENVETFLVKAIQLGIALMLCVPLVLLYSVGIAPTDEFSKILVFQIILEITLIFYVWLILINKNYLPKRSTLLFAVVGFFAIQVIASLLGTYFYRSFFGSIWRGDGLVLQAHLLAFFFIIISVFRDRQEWMRLLYVATSVSGLSSMVAILQRLGVVSLHNTGWCCRVSGTLVSPGLFGNYIALAIFIALFVAASERKKSLKALWFSIVGLHILALILSETRGALAGAFAGLLVMALFYVPSFIIFFKNRSSMELRKKILVAGFLGLLIVIGAGLFLLSSHTLGSRLLDILSFNLETSRQATWSMAKTAFLQKPLLGWGYDSFGYFWQKNFHGVLYEMSHYNVLTDKPHNKVLEILVSSGLAGLLSWLAIIFIAGRYLFIKSLHDKNIKIIFLGFLVCYVVSNLFLFDAISTFILFFVVLGFIHYSHTVTPTQEAPEPKRSFSWLKGVVVLAFAIGILFVTYALNIRVSLAHMYFFTSRDATLAPEALYGYQKVLSMKTFHDADIKLLVLGKLSELAGFDSNIAAGYKKYSFDLFTKELPHIKQVLSKLEQDKIGYYYDVAMLHKSFYLYDKDKKHLEDAENLTKEAIIFNPNNPLAYQAMAEVKILMNQYQEGQTYANMFYKSLPQNSMSQRMMRQTLAKAYIENNDGKKGFEEVKQLLDLDYVAKKENGEGNNLFDASRLIDVVSFMYYNQTKDQAQVEMVLEKAVQIYPKYQHIFQSHLDEIAKEHQAAQSSGK